MRKQKQKVTQLHSAALPSQNGDLQRGTLPWAHDMSGQALNMTQQLETVARRLSGMPAGNSENEQTDLSSVMGLFAENLSQISALLEEVRIVMEDTDPTILKAANG
jgi:hypothetical protein